jgi:hypothetical protein
LYQAPFSCKFQAAFDTNALRRASHSESLALVLEVERWTFALCFNV